LRDTLGGAPTRVSTQGDFSRIGARIGPEVMVDVENALGDRRSTNATQTGSRRRRCLHGLFYKPDLRRSDLLKLYRERSVPDTSIRSTPDAGTDKSPRSASPAGPVFRVTTRLLPPWLLCRACRVPSRIRSRPGKDHDIRERGQTPSLISWGRTFSYSVTPAAWRPTM
jgi:hypothetical protein